jgi:TetR/AcrR family transcriptional regulator, mexCD-oprJ operon repressor
VQDVRQTVRARAATTTDPRTREDGSFRVEVDPEWVLAMLTWLLVAVADTVRLGRQTPGAAQRHLGATILSAVVRPAT